MFAFLFVLPAFMMGCASSPAKRTAEMSKQMTKQSANVDDIQRRVDAVDVAFNHLESSNPMNIRPAYDAFSDEVKNLKKAEKRSDSQYGSLLDTREAYIADWRTENKKLTNPTLKDAASSNYKQTIANYDALSNRASNMRSAYNTYVNDLDQIESFLKDNLSKNSIARITPVIKKARTHGETLKASAREYQTALRQAYSTIPPAYK